MVSTGYIYIFISVMSKIMEDVNAPVATLIWELYNRVAGLLLSSCHD